ncbi:hypothetical protein [Actinophytocola sp.]|uniref:hypothetical protein n=1 Tax=Actinophytocola sp. TaxID=1872138 RepID=UPI003D6C016C
MVDHQVERAQQVGHDVPGAHSVGEVDRAPEVDDRENALPGEHERDELRAVVAADPAGGIGDGAQHVAAHEAEHRVRERAGHGRLPVGGEAPETRTRERDQGPPAGQHGRHAVSLPP